MQREQFFLRIAKHCVPCIIPAFDATIKQQETVLDHFLSHTHTKNTKRSKKKLPPQKTNSPLLLRLDASAAPCGSCVPLVLAPVSLSCAPPAFAFALVVAAVTKPSPSFDHCGRYADPSDSVRPRPFIANIVRGRSEMPSPEDEAAGADVDAGAGAGADADADGFPSPPLLCFSPALPRSSDAALAVVCFLRCFVVFVTKSSSPSSRFIIVVVVVVVVVESGYLRSQCSLLAAVPMDLRALGGEGCCSCNGLCARVQIGRVLVFVWCNSLGADFRRDGSPHYPPSPPPPPPPPLDFKKHTHTYIHKMVEPEDVTLRFSGTGLTIKIAVSAGKMRPGVLVEIKRGKKREMRTASSKQMCTLFRHFRVHLKQLFGGQTLSWIEPNSFVVSSIPFTHSPLDRCIWVVAVFPKHSRAPQPKWRQDCGIGGASSILATWKPCMPCG